MSGDVSRSQAWAIVLLAVCVLVLAALDWLRAGQVKLLEEDMGTVRGQLLDLRAAVQAKTTPAPRGRPRKSPEAAA